MSLESTRLKTTLLGNVFELALDDTGASGERSAVATAPDLATELADRDLPPLPRDVRTRRANPGSL
jgi:hypothetical protein